MGKIVFGIVGTGWRAEFFLRAAFAYPDLFEVAGVTSRNPDKRAKLTHTWGVRSFETAEELVDNTECTFIVTCVPTSANVDIINKLVKQNMPVLSETPPAPDVEGLISLHDLGARIQVAEQYHLQPHHAARISVALSGKLGTVSQAQVSSAHGYHGISLIRRLLGITFQPCTINSFSFNSPLVAGSGREGPPEREKMGESSQLFFRLDFGEKLGILDFTGDQYFSWIRNERVLVRGERGEIINKEVTYLKDFLTPVKLDFVRHETGNDGNLEGKYLRGIQLGEEIVYKNLFFPAPLTDEELAVATCLKKMARFVDTGETFYPLAEASQDQYLSLMCSQALQEGRSVQTEMMPWAKVG